MKMRDILRRLTDDGWQPVGQKGSHKQFAHPTKPGKVTVPVHSSNDEITGGLLRSIFRQAGWSWETRR